MRPSITPAPEGDDDEHVNSDFEYASSTPHAPICEHASFCDSDGRCAMLSETDWQTVDNQTPTRNMASLVKHVHGANSTPSGKDDFELVRGGKKYFSDTTPQQIFNTGTTELEADKMRYLNEPLRSLTHVIKFLRERKFYRIAGLNGTRPANLTMTLSIKGLCAWSTAKGVPEVTRTALQDVAGRLQGCPLKNTECIMRLQLPPQHKLNAKFKGKTSCACNSEIVPARAAPTQLWHRDKVDMGMGRGKPTVRVMSRWLGVRKKSHPNKQYWGELKTPAYILSANCCRNSWRNCMRKMRYLFLYILFIQNCFIQNSLIYI
jgi:hypothetical protein